MSRFGEWLKARRKTPTNGGFLVLVALNAVLSHLRAEQYRKLERRIADLEKASPAAVAKVLREELEKVVGTRMTPPPPSSAFREPPQAR